MSITINQRKYRVSVSSQGYNITVGAIQGPKGPPGPGVSSSAIAGAPIAVHQVVSMINGLLYPADATDLSHAGRLVGIATQGGLAGASINYQFTGELGGGGFVTNSLYYLGASGSLSTSPTFIGQVWSVAIGVAKSSSELVLTIGETVQLG